MKMTNDLSERSFSGSSTRSGSDGNDKMDSREKLIRREERHVRTARVAVAAATLLCAVAMSVAVYAFSTQGEFNSFKLEYDIYVQEIIKLVTWEVQYNFALMQQLSASVTATAVMTGAVFPNLTQPYFEITGGYTDGLGGIMMAAFAPLVKAEKRAEWEEYSTRNQDWMATGETLRKIHPGHRDPMHGTHQDHEHDRRLQEEVRANISGSIFHWESGEKVPEDNLSEDDYAPLWQVSPPDASSINANLFSENGFKDLFSSMKATNHSVLSSVTEIGDMFDFMFDPEEKDKKNAPHAFIMEPVYSEFSDDPELVGMVIALTNFGNLLDRLIPEHANGIICVVTDPCGPTVSYVLNGPKSLFLGYGDLHDPSFDKYKRSALIEVKGNGVCNHELHIFPSTAFQETFYTNMPIIYSSVVALAFLMTTILLVVYDRTVTQRQEKTMKFALRSGALVDSLFPANVRDRVMEGTNVNIKKTSKGAEEIGDFGTRPIADFFPSVTMLFADISGFTAWSSAREPCQVFELLETIFGAFDVIAKKRRIFKVETVGDCYVAVCGIPTATKDHAVAMARFAKDCMQKMDSLIKQLEVKLGPDTSALSFRMGLHSGPVTGGVLRGDNARFQLFGDTVNTAARMESTGRPRRIQLSQTTADHLIQASKSNWIVPRDEIVQAKGKGIMKTYWLVLNHKRSDVASSTGHSGNSDSAFDPSEPEELETMDLDPRAFRLVNWNVEILLRLLKHVVVRRLQCTKGIQQKAAEWYSSCKSAKTVIDEVAEIITLPSFASPTDSLDIEAVVLDDATIDQLREYVNEIASLYNNNPFHNFDHASHVVMSVSKLLGRIVAPPGDSNTASSLHDHTYGITSDPLTQFACVFSALIHDVGHAGVPNTQLVKERAPVASTYSNKSVAEQNSVDVAWSLLMEPKFEQLRGALCATSSETRRFRQLVVNAVMATDIMASDLKVIRNNRWNKAFYGNSETGAAAESLSDSVNRKATIVIEHLLQASDVCHTMQHWHIYRKWNERLFVEMSKAYAEGRAEKDPSETWYQGEIGFFDFYIIPLAKKLEQCGVFGVSSDEYLNYAIKNRDEWEAHGEEIVREMVKSVKGKAMKEGMISI